VKTEGLFKLAKTFNLQSLSGLVAGQRLGFSSPSFSFFPSNPLFSNA
jgi:hypothetical protein